MTAAVISQIDEKIYRLKKRREKLQIQQALFFIKEVQKIFQEDFSFDVALSIMRNAWDSASETQKKEWKKPINSFRPVIQKTRKEADPIESIPIKS